MDTHARVARRFSESQKLFRESVSRHPLFFSPLDRSSPLGLSTRWAIANKERGSRYRKRRKLYYQRPEATRSENTGRLGKRE